MQFDTKVIALIVLILLIVMFSLWKVMGSSTEEEFRNRNHTRGRSRRR